MGKSQAVLHLFPQVIRWSLVRPQTLFNAQQNKKAVGMLFCVNCALVPGDSWMPAWYPASSPVGKDDLLGAKGDG